MEREMAIGRWRLGLSKSSRFTAKRTGHGEKPLVIVFQNGMLDACLLCDNADQAEKVFLDKCSVLFSHWGKYTADDIDNILDDGFYDNNDNKKTYICIVWPETIHASN